MTTEPTTPDTPTTVEPGQIWRDNDQRTRGTGEFTVVDATDAYAYVRRHKTGRMTRISVDRMLNHGGRQRGYTYLGVAR